MNNKELLKLIKERNDQISSSASLLYDYLYSINKEDGCNFLLELFFEGKENCISNDYFKIAEIFEDNNLKAARYLYLYDIVANTKKYSFTGINGYSGIYFDNKWKELLSKEIREPLYAFYLEDKKHIKKIKKLVEKSKATDNLKKKEKLLLKTVKYDDGYSLYELASFYYKNGNKDSAFEYFEKSFKREYPDAAIFLADYYHELKDVDKEINYLIGSIRRDEHALLYRLLKLLEENNRTLDRAYRYLEWNVYRDNSLFYELARFYETGKYCEKDELCAYILYMCARGYNDSNQKLTELRKSLGEIYKEKNNIVLNNIVDKINDETLEKKETNKKRKEEINKLNAQYPPINITLNPDVKSYEMLFDKKGALKERERLYKVALKAKEPYEIIPALEEAAKANHHNALLALFEIYKDYDIEKAYFYITALKNTYTRDDDLKVSIKNIFEEYHQKREKILEENYQKQQKLIAEEKKRLEEIALEEKRNNPLGLDKEPNYQRENESDVVYEKGVAFYQEALSKRDINEIVNALEKAADNQHPKAIYHLLEYYQEKDQKAFKKLFIQALNLDHQLIELSDFQIDFEFEIELLRSKKEFAFEILDRYVNKEFTEEDLKFIEDYAFVNDNYYIQKSCLSFLIEYHSTRSSEKDIYYCYLYNKACNDDQKLIKCISKYVSLSNPNPLKQIYIDVLFEEQYKNDIDVTLLIYDILMNNNILKNLKLPYNYSDGVKLLHSLEPLLNKYNKRKVYSVLAKHYETRTSNILKAIEYYDLCKDKEKANELRKKYNYDKMWERKQNDQAEELMRGYPCAELDEMLSKDITKAKNIVKVYGSFDRSVVIKDMIERDRLLNMGFTLNQMYNDLGHFEGYKLAGKTPNKQNVSAVKPVTINQETSVIEPIENDVKVCLFGKISSDPNDPDHKYHSNDHFLASASICEIYRQNKDWSIATYGSMQGFYIEEFLINGTKFNDAPFYHHLNLTLSPGSYDIQITVKVIQNYPGYMPSTYALNRSDAGSYFVKSNVKNKTFRFKKTFKIDKYNIHPGQVYYIAVFAIVLGEWYRIYDQYSKRYEGKERKNVYSDFSILAKPETSIKNDERFFHLNENDFISIDDIGKPQYDPLDKWVETK